MKKKKSERQNELTVCELFAGVGGFRLGFEGRRPGATKGMSYRTVWANQWEPGKRKQLAADVYRTRFHADFPYFNEDIEKVLEEHYNSIPDHDLLCGGFPCQDYSVARTLRQATGIRGKKGVLWWSIHRLVDHKLKEEGLGRGKAPRYLVLENVDRLLKSPKGQRGRDFAVMLASLANLGYAVEWRVINAADYGCAQRRRRVFIVAYHPDSPLYKRMKRARDHRLWLSRDGLLAKAFPVKLKEAAQLVPSLTLAEGRGAVTQENLVEITHRFNKHGKKDETPFKEAGVMFDYDIWTAKVAPVYNGRKRTLRSVLVPESKVPREYYLDHADLKKWRYLKGPKSASRINRKTGIEYSYDEGGMSFPDPLDRPSRTIVTGEGGKTPSRFKHVVEKRHGHPRRLTPVELERLNGFPDDHTKLDGISDNARAFFMGNALVVDIVRRIGAQLKRELRRR